MKTTTHRPNLETVTVGQDEFITACLGCGQEIHLWDYLDYEDRKRVFNPWHTLTYVELSNGCKRGEFGYDCPNA